MVSCVIIDSDAWIRQSIELYCAQTPYVSLMGSYETGFDALVHLQHQSVEVVITDTYLPDMTIHELIGMLPDRPQLILTSAAPFFAVEAFSLGAVDFVLRPVVLQRFVQALARANEQAELRRIRTAMSEPTPKAAVMQYLFVQSEYRAVRVDLANILYIEGLKDYVKIHLAVGKPILTITRMKLIEERLPAVFVRIHRSFIAHIKHVDAVQKNRIFIGDREIPVGEMYVANLFASIGM